MDFERFTHLTFDCYGTLIDWETGILEALMPLMARSAGTFTEKHLPHSVTEPNDGRSMGESGAPTEEQVLRLYTRFEAEEEAGDYKPYRIVLENISVRIAAERGVELSEADRAALPNSVGQWPPFPDSVAALKELKSRFKLVILSNIDDALFAQSNPHLGVEFDEIITAEQLRSYKPRKAHFEAALARLDVPRGQILHVAQSLHHDHVPAKEMGFSTVWINRPSRLTGTGLAPPANVRPDLELPDLRSLAAAIHSN